MGCTIHGLFTFYLRRFFFRLVTMSANNSANHNVELSLTRHPSLHFFHLRIDRQRRAFLLMDIYNTNLQPMKRVMGVLNDNGVLPSEGQVYLPVSGSAYYYKTRAFLSQEVDLLGDNL